MALASSIIMLRRASSSLLIPPSFPAVRSSAALLAVDRSLVVPLSRFSTSSAAAAAVPSRQFAKEDLVRMLDVEIERTNKNWNTCVPLGFPFRIENTESEDTVILWRRYEDEIIKAQVKISVHDVVADIDIDVSMFVTISKESGNSELLFEMWGPCYGRINIGSLYIKKDLWGSVADLDRDIYHFNHMKWETQEGWYKYLDMRGINLTNISLLREKIMAKPDKESMEFKDWLCNLKKFLA